MANSSGDEIVKHGVIENRLLNVEAEKITMQGDWLELPSPGIMSSNSCAECV